MKRQIAYIGIKGVPYSGGAERVVQAILEHLDSERYEATVYCNARLVSSDEMSHPGVSLIRVPAFPGKYLNAPSHFLFSVLHALLFGKYDLVHLHNVESAFVLPLIRLRYHVISTSHGQAQARDKWGALAKKAIGMMEYPFLKLSNAVTSVSKPLADYYEARFKRSVHYIPNGVSANEQIDSESAAELLAVHGLEPGKFILFAAGRIIPTKGCRTLLRAFGKLEEEVRLLVVGNADQMPDYRRELYSLADERVTFLPFVDSKATLMGLVSSASLFVFPSTVEAMSMMLLEAATVGTPIVCSNIPENLTVLPDQALVFNVGDATDLSDKLSWALTHPQEMQLLAQKAKARVNQHFRWERIVREYEILYDTNLPSRAPFQKKLAEGVRTEN